MNEFCLSMHINKLIYNRKILNCEVPEQHPALTGVRPPYSITYKKVCGQRCYHEAGEGLLLLVPDVAETSQVVGVHQPHDEDDDGFDGWDGPGCYVKVGTVHFNGLMAPFQSGSQKPGKGQDHPPGKEGAKQGLYIANL